MRGALETSAAENCAPAQEGPMPAASGRSAGLFWSTAAVLTFVMYWICLRFVSPGYFAPLSPFHVDFYSYAAVARTHFAELLLRYPRPITYIGFKLLGGAGLKPMMAAGIGIALLDVVLTLSLLIKLLELRSHWLPLSYALYTFLLFSHPQFYVEHRHDLPAEWSLLFLSISLLAWLKTVSQPRIRLAPLLVALVSAVLFVFAKETYFISAICIVAGLALTRPVQRGRHLAFLLFLVAIECVSFEWTNHFNGPFVNVNADPAAPYHMSLAPADVARTFIFYLYNLVNPGLILVVLLGITSVWKSRSRVIISIALLCAGLTAFATVSVLPNHKFEEYAWAGAVFFLAPALLVTESAMTSQWKFAPFLLLTMFSAMAVAGPNGYRAAYNTNGARWWIAQDERGTRLATSFARFQDIHRPAHILVTGLDDPGVPWQFDGFIRLQFGDQLFWTIVLPPKVDYRLNSPLATFIDPAQVRLADYDFVAEYRADGELIGIRPAGPINASEGLVPVIIPELSGLAPLPAAKLCLDWGFPEESEGYLERARAKDPDVTSDNTFLELQAELPAEMQKRLEASLPAELVVRPELYNRPELTARPAHIIQPDHSGLGVTQLSWNVPVDVRVEIHINSPKGALFTTGRKSGSATTGKWVRNGMKFFLQDVTGGKPLIAKNTIAVVRVQVD